MDYHGFLINVVATLAVAKKTNGKKFFERLE
jgi:hypothetical protein